MDKRLFFELLVELNHGDTWVHYYFVYHKTFVIISVFFFLPMIPLNMPVKHGIIVG
jgi:hypothetical protein